ncbi:hypothetical protein [Streptomyces formicae]
MRPLYVLLVAALLALVGVCPSIASVVGGAVGLALAGAEELLSQPALLGLTLVGLALAAYRHRPVGHARRA